MVGISLTIYKMVTYQTISFISPGLYCKIKLVGLEKQTYKSLDRDDQLLKMDRPLCNQDLVRLVELIELHLSAINEGAGRDLVVLFGPTRAGKTTSYHFLRGKKIVKKEWEYPHPEFDCLTVQKTGYELCDEADVGTAKIGHGFIAETKTMNLVQYKNYYLVDTAGLFDTQGAIEEISHMVALEHIIKIAKSIRPVLLINVEELSGSAKIVDSMVKFTQTMFTDDDSLFNSLFVILTHIHNPSEVPSKFAQLYDKLKKESKQENTLVKKIIQWLVGKSDKVKLLKDPDIENPNDYWSAISRETLPLSDKCNLCIEDSSLNQFNLLLSNLRNELPKKMEEQDFEFILQIVEVLSKLNPYLGKLVKETLELYSFQVADMLLNEHRKIKSRIGSLLNNRHVGEEDIEEIQVFRNKIVKSKVFRSHELVAEKLKELEHFDDSFISKVQEFASELPALLNKSHWDTCHLLLNVLEKLGNLFGDLEQFREIYEVQINIAKEFIHQLKSKLYLTDICFYSNDQNLDSLVIFFDNIKKASVLQAHLDAIAFYCDSEIVQSVKQVNATFEAALEDVAEGLKDFENNPDKDIRRFEVYAVSMQKISNYYSLFPFLQEDTCKKYINEMSAQIRDKINQIIELLKQSASINPKLPLRAAHKLSHVASDTQIGSCLLQLINDVKTRFLGKYKEIKQKLEMQLESDQLEIIVKLFRQMKKWDWLDEIVREFTSKKIQRVQKLIQNKIKRIFDSIKACWDREEFDKCKYFIELFRDLEESELLEESFHVLEKSQFLQESPNEQPKYNFEEIVKTYEGKIKGICDKINEDMNKDAVGALLLTSINHKLFLLKTFKNWNLFCIMQVTETIEKLQNAFEETLKQKSFIFSREEKEITKELVEKQWQVFQYLKESQKCSELQGFVLPQLQIAKQAICEQIHNLKIDFHHQLSILEDPCSAEKLLISFSHYTIFVREFSNTDDPTQSEYGFNLNKDFGEMKRIYFEKNKNAQEEIKSLLERKKFSEIRTVLESISVPELRKKSQEFIFTQFNFAFTILCNSIKHFEPKEDCFKKQSKDFKHIFGALKEYIEFDSCLSPLVAENFAKSGTSSEEYKKQISELLKDVYEPQLKQIEYLLERFAFPVAQKFKEYLLQSSNQFSRQMIFDEGVRRDIFKLDDAYKSAIDSLEKNLEYNLKEGHYSAVNQIWKNSKSLSIEIDEFSETRPEDKIKEIIAAFFNKEIDRLIAEAGNKKVTEAKETLAKYQSIVTLDSDIQLIIKPILDRGKESMESTIAHQKGNIKKMIENDCIPDLKKELLAYKGNDQERYLQIEESISSKFDDLIKTVDQGFEKEDITAKLDLALQYSTCFDDIETAPLRHLEKKCLARYTTIAADVKKTVEYSGNLNLLNTQIPLYNKLTTFFLQLVNQQKSSSLTEIKKTYMQTIESLVQFAKKLQMDFSKAFSEFNTHLIVEYYKKMEEFSVPFKSISTKAAFLFSQESYQSIVEGIEKFPDALFLAKLLREKIDAMLHRIRECFVSRKVNELGAFVNHIEQMDNLQPIVKDIVQVKANLLKEFEKEFKNLANFSSNYWKARDYTKLNESLSFYVHAEKFRLGLHLQINNDPIDPIIADLQELSNSIILGTADAIANFLFESGICIDQVPCLEGKVKPIISQFTSKLSVSGNILAVYSALTTNYKSDQGKLIVSYLTNEFPAFNAFMQKIMKKKTGNFGIEYVLSNIVVPEGITLSDLRQDYQTFEGHFDELVEQGLITKNYDLIVEYIANIRGQASVRGNLPIILANLFAFWSLSKSDIELISKTQDFEYFVKPHAAQVLSIFILLNRSGDPRNIRNILAEIKTGEGKSITLGICAIVIALIGYDVDVVSYSRLLSERDKNDFQALFKQFGVAQKIQYGTIEELSERFINRDGEVRALLNDLLAKRAKPPRQSQTAPPKVLLIDEVDVFFSDKFLGETYNPISLLTDDRCYRVLQYIWKNHSNPDQMKITNLSQLGDFVSILNEYPNMRQIFHAQLHQMITDVENYNDPQIPYKLNKLTGMIGYKLHDEISYSLFYGYRTIFAYFAEKDKGNITEDVLKKKVGFLIYAARFSFAQIPTQYQFTLGVTGTLKSLSETEKKLISKLYKINNFAYLPSMYGESKLDFKPASDVFVLSDFDQYLVKIKELAEENMKKGRAVIVFFEDQAKIDSFKNSNYFASEWSILTEESFDKPSLFRKATCAGQCTLSTRSFGRGIDFISRDERVEQAGGVVVIQAFFSLSVSDEIQSKGRTARQGARGNYYMVLLQNDLLHFFPDEQSLKLLTGSRQFYQEMDKIRRNAYEAQLNELESKVQNAGKTNSMSDNLRRALISGNWQDKQIWTYLASINMEFYQSSKASNYYIVMCLDESGSMYGDPWQQLVSAVNKFASNRISKCNLVGAQCSDIISIISYGSSARTQISNEPLSATIGSSLSFASGGTNFAAGISLSHTQFTRYDLTGFTPVFLFMSDGGASNGENEMIHLYQSLPEMKVFVIGFGSGCDESKLKSLADLAKGNYLFGETGDILEQEFERVAVSLSSPSYI